ncbi:AfsR/SARP family transcriptional regulator [Luteipulveratus flavus]|uniref:BTAD domain-containing putative transcriptional regulator n=1 Tax=Luteipulveratus flavus TaxID=3031728 RepID=A0ABT6C4P3_9MICO|nr:BTAD domain-containing putative transcriptional regulator [Luteipulveratus sp. YIM 133296]MDF8263857.1 BTAD domain-containing putative transcriptional regulator [Luteipulveratus sp. YIM 133296]
MLARLVLADGRVVPADALVDALWDDPPPTARQQLYNAVAQLRRALADASDALVRRGPGYALSLHGHRVDLHDFRSAVATARAGGRGAERHLRDGLALWRGRPLEGVPDHLAEPIRRPLEQEQTDARELLCRLTLESGNPEDALAQAGELVGACPFQESAHELRLRALAATGRRTQALQEYLAFRNRLVDELGVDPGAALQALHADLLDGTTGDVGRSTSLVPVPQQLPPATAALVGRDKLIAGIADRIDEAAGSPAAATPLVLFTGPGGVGKTSVAIAAARRVGSGFADGVLFAELRAGSGRPTDPYDVHGRFLRALGHAVEDVPDDRDERLASYRSALADRSVLVVLDDAGTEAQVRALLPPSPASAVIVTSRARLAGLEVTARVRVPTLEPDASEELLGLLSPHRSPALVRLAELCGHLPLALRVAGSRLAVDEHLSVDDLISRLTRERARLEELTAGDLDVRATIAISHEAVRPQVQHLFRCLGAVDYESWPDWVADLVVTNGASLGELVDVHLVEDLGLDAAGQRRFRMHDLVRDFARSLASEAPAPVAQAQWCVLLDTWHDRAEAAVGDLTGSAGPTSSDGLEASDWLETERANLCAAVDQAAAAGLPDLCGRLALTICEFFMTRGYDDDRERALRAALGSVGTGSHPELRSDLLRALFATLAQQGRLDELDEVAEANLATTSDLPASDRAVRAIFQSAWLAETTYALPRAARLYERAADLARSIGSAEGVASAQGNLGSVHLRAGDWDVALPLLVEGVQHERAGDRPRHLAIRLALLGECRLWLGDAHAARAHFDEARDITWTISDQVGEALCQIHLATVHLHLGELADAIRLLQPARAAAMEHTGFQGDLLAWETSVDLSIIQRRWDHAEREIAQVLDGMQGDPHRGIELARFAARSAVVQDALNRPREAATQRECCVRHLRALDLPARCLRLPPQMAGVAASLD